MFYDYDSLVTILVTTITIPYVLTIVIHLCNAMSMAKHWPKCMYIVLVLIYF